MGRPALPKGEAKGAQIGVRFNPADDKKIEKDIAGTSLTKADWIRDAAQVKMQEWVVCKWTAKDLDRKTVEFRIVSNVMGPVQGTGKFYAIERGDGKLKIKIESHYKHDEEKHYNFFYIRQESVDWIVKMPLGSKNDFSCLDPALQS